MTFALNPGCCCDGSSTPCIIYSDDFNRSDDTDVGADWTEIFGDWSISGNALTVASTFLPGVIVSASAPSTQLYKAVWSFSASSGEKLRIIFGYVDTSNYYFAELHYHASTGYVKLYERSAGVDTELASTDNYDTTTALDFTLCYNGSHLAANHGNAQSYVSAGITAPSGTELFGAGVLNPTSAGDVLFGSVVLYEVSEECADCPPGNCCATDEDSPFQVKCIFDGDGPPQQIRVQTSGATDDGGSGCGWCSGEPANGDWILTNVSGNDPCNTHTNDPCSYLYSEHAPQSADACIGGNYACQIEIDLTFSWLDVGSTFQIGLAQRYYTSNPGAGDDCTTDPCGTSVPSSATVAFWTSGSIAWTPGGVSALSLTGISMTLSASIGLGGCDFSSATCTVDVLA